MKPVCKICGKPESEHHKFVAKLPVPKGCICENKITKICDKYKGNGICYCSRCEHDMQCHKV